MWEIFSFGEKPCEGFTKTKMIQVFFYLIVGRNIALNNVCFHLKGFLSGWRPPRPEKCLGEVYHIMIGTWYPDVSLRPKAQSVMRDINQILYEGTDNWVVFFLNIGIHVLFFSLVYNSRRSNVYEQVNDHHRSLNGSLASGLTEATSIDLTKFLCCHLFDNRCHFICSTQGTF